MRIVRNALGAVFAVLLPIVTQAQAEKLPVTRLEIHPLRSMTLSDSQFLRGEKGEPAMVAGELRLPNAPGKLPVVVLIHGSGGPGANIPMWEDILNGMGIATFALDGFSGRGIVQTSTNQAALGRLNLILDAYVALEVLAKNPRVDPQRIVLMGFSRGGQATLYAAMSRFHRMWNKSGAEFAAYIPFYPDCKTQYRQDDELAAKPIRMFHGAPDDYNPPAACTAFLERLKAHGVDATQTIYPDAAHGFDSQIPPMPVVAKGSQTVRNCSIKEEAEGALIDQQTHQTFTYTNVCVELDPHVGGNAPAREAAIKAVTEFLGPLFARGNP